MNKLWAVIKWLFHAQNPIPLWGFFPCLVWFIFLLQTGIYFGVFEYLGKQRTHGMIMFTWFLRPSVPPIVWFILGPIAVWHFDFVKTRAIQAYQYLVQ